MSKGYFVTRNYSHYVKSVRFRSYSGQYSVPMRENMDQNNSEYAHFLRSVGILKFFSYDENLLFNSKDLDEKISHKMFCKEKISYKMLRKLLEMEAEFPVSKS